MTITLAMIAERIFDIDFEYFQGTMSEQSQVSKVKVLQAKQSSIDSDTLYVTTLSYLASEYKGDIPLSVACIKNVEIDIDHELFAHTNLILVKNSMDILELFNLIQDIYFYYSDMYSQLLQIVEDNKGLQYLIDKLSALLGNPMDIIDHNYKILAITTCDPKNAELWRKIDKTSRHNGYVVHPNENYNLVRNFITKMAQNDKPVFFHTDEGFLCEMISLNIRLQKKNTAILSVFEIDTPFNKATSDLVVFISQILSLELQKNEMLLLNGEIKCADQIADILNGKTLSHSDIEKILNRFNYSISNNYTVVVVKSPISSYSYELPYLRNNILNFLMCVSCIIYERSIVMVFDAFSFNSFNYYLPKFSELLSATMNYAGISNPFPDIMEIRRGYVEACKAVELGLRINADGPIYRYADLQFYNLIDVCSKQENIKELCHPALTQLMKSDSELLKTLYTYMKNNGSQSKTAKELCIQRSSLLYRLKKIEDEYKIELEDYQTRLHLQLSYEIFNYLHPKHSQEEKFPTAKKAEDKSRKGSIPNFV